MVEKIINILLIPFKVRYVKKNFSRHYKPHYYIYINVGTILKPLWYNYQYTLPESFKEIFKVYKITVNHYKFMKDRPNNNINYDTVDFHEQLMK